MEYTKVNAVSVKEALGDLLCNGKAVVRSILRVPLVKQHDEKDCGVACMSMILDYYGRKVSFAQLRESIKVDQDGANLYGLLDCAAKNGLKAQAFSGSPEDFFKSISNGQVSFPLIARVLNHNTFEHYVVVKAVVGNRVYINDPDSGHLAMKRDVFADCFLGQIVTFATAEDFEKANFRKGNANRFLRLVTCQAKRISVICLLSIMITGIGLAGSYVFQYLIDGVLSDIDDLCCAEEALELFAVVITGIGLLYLFKLAFELLRGKLLVKMSREIDIPLMLNCFNRTVDLRMSFFDTHKSGEIISRLADSGKIRDALSSATLTLMIDTVMAVVGGITLYRISSTLFNIAFAMFFVYSVISLIYIKPLDNLNNDLMVRNAEFQSYLKETMDGIETVKLNGLEKKVKEKMSGLFTKFIEKNAKGSMVSISKEAVIAFITSVGTLALLWVGTVEIINGQMTVGNLIVFYSLMGYFLTPVQNLIDLQSGVQSAIVAGKRLNDIMDLPAEDTEAGETTDRIINSITFDNVSFRYGNRDLVLDGVNFSTNRGKHLALVGGSGSGKSTITKLLMGMYVPEDGRILINGAPISQYSIEWLRKRIAVITQDTFLFADTIRHNLLSGISKQEVPSDADITALLDMCGCQFIQKLPFGLDTMLEENGVNLSGGQRQRLAIVRALLRKPDVLIMDEATSNLDAISEHRILHAIGEICPNAIIIAAAHRLSTISGFNSIIVLEDGKIAEQGSHTELIANDDLYARMWTIQNNTAD